MTDVKKASTTKVSGGKDDKGKDAPDNTLPGLEKPDNSLPGDQPKPDQGLPPVQGRPDQGLPPEGVGPDNSLPGDQPRPDQGLPGAQPGPDNSLPGAQPGPDNSLPGAQPGPDNSLPGDQPRPDQGLPGAQPGPDNSLPGAQPGPDNELPGQPPRPDNSLPPGVDNELPPHVDNELPPVDTEDLIEDIFSAEKLEIVYCDGSGPIGIPALKVTKSEFRVTSLGVKLEREEVLIFGPGREQRAYELDGYALFADGNQIAYAKRPEPLTIGNGMTMDVSGDIVFPVKERDDRK